MGDWTSPRGRLAFLAIALVFSTHLRCLAQDLEHSTTSLRGWWWGPRDSMSNWARHQPVPDVYEAVEVPRVMTGTMETSDEGWVSWPVTPPPHSSSDIQQTNRVYSTSAELQTPTTHDLESIDELAEEVIAMWPTLSFVTTTTEHEVDENYASAEFQGQTTNITQLSTLQDETSVKPTTKNADLSTSNDQSEMEGNSLGWTLHNTSWFLLTSSTDTPFAKDLRTNTPQSMMSTQDSEDRDHFWTSGDLWAGQTTSFRERGHDLSKDLAHDVYQSEGSRSTTVDLSFPSVPPIFTTQGNIEQMSGATVPQLAENAEQELFAATNSSNIDLSLLTPTTFDTTETEEAHVKSIEKSSVTSVTLSEPRSVSVATSQPPWWWWWWWQKEEARRLEQSSSATPSETSSFGEGVEQLPSLDEAEFSHNTHAAASTMISALASEIPAEVGLKTNHMLPSTPPLQGAHGREEASGDTFEAQIVAFDPNHDPTFENIETVTASPSNIMYDWRQASKVPDGSSGGKVDSDTSTAASDLTSTTGSPPTRSISAQPQTSQTELPAFLGSSVTSTRPTEMRVTHDATSAIVSSATGVATQRQSSTLLQSLPTVSSGAAAQGSTSSSRPPPPLLPMPLSKGSKSDRDVSPHLHRFRAACALASLFILLGLFSLVGLVLLPASQPFSSGRHHSCTAATIAAVQGFLLSLCVGRATGLLLSVVGAFMPPAAHIAMHDACLPCLTSAFATVALALGLSARSKQPPQQSQGPTLLAATVAVHLAAILGVALASGLLSSTGHWAASAPQLKDTTTATTSRTTEAVGSHAEETSTHYTLLAIRMLTTVWGIILCIAFFLAFPVIIIAAGDRAKEMENASRCKAKLYGLPRDKGCSAARGLQYAGLILLAAAVFGLGYFALFSYAALSSHTVVPNLDSEHEFLWLPIQCLLRSFELFIGFCVFFAALQLSRVASPQKPRAMWRKFAQSLIRHRKCTNVLPEYSDFGRRCAENAQSTQALGHAGQELGPGFVHNHTEFVKMVSLQSKSYCQNGAKVSSNTPSNGMICDGSRSHCTTSIDNGKLTIPSSPTWKPRKPPTCESIVSVHSALTDPMWPTSHPQPHPRPENGQQHQQQSPPYETRYKGSTAPGGPPDSFKDDTSELDYESDTGDFSGYPPNLSWVDTLPAGSHWLSAADRLWGGRSPDTPVSFSSSCRVLLPPSPKRHNTPMQISQTPLVKVMSEGTPNKQPDLQNEFMDVCRQIDELGASTNSLTH